YIIINSISSSSSYIFLTLFLLKSSHVDRSVFTDDSELNVESLIKNLKNTIMKKLSMSCVTESLTSLSTSSTASFPAALSQSSTLVSMSGSPASATPVPVILTPATPGFIISAFITSSPCFKKMLYRLNKSCFSRITSLLNSVEIIKDIHVFRNRNMNIVLFYTHKYETYTS
ncbi:hypothetical protein BDBG_00001, partial [Blastomyces gilchristii SLH14081]